MVLTKMEKASNGVRFLTRVMISWSIENIEGYSFLVSISITDKRRPHKMEYVTATTTENFALLA